MPENISITIVEPTLADITLATPMVQGLTVTSIIGPKGDPGDSAGALQNTFIQRTDPALATPYIWWQVDISGNLVTVWVKS
jgi:hypothetical protein